MITNIKIINDFEKKYDCNIIAYEGPYTNELRIIKSNDIIKLWDSVFLEDLTEQEIIKSFNKLLNQLRDNKDSYDFIWGYEERQLKLQKIINNI